MLNNWQVRKRLQKTWSSSSSTIWVPSVSPCPGSGPAYASSTNRIAGQVEKSIKNTDIGLVNLGDIMLLNNNEANVVNDIQVRALVHSKKLGMRETYLVCLPGTEPQLLYRFGKRFEITNDASQPNSVCIKNIHIMHTYPVDERYRKPGDGQCTGNLDFL